MRGHDGAAAVDPPVLIVQVQLRFILDEIHVGLPEALHRADVLPVSLKAVGEHAPAIPQHGGDDVFAEVVLRAFLPVIPHQELPQHRPGKNINSHGSLVALGLPRLFLKFHNAVVRVRVHDAEAVRFFHGNLQNGNGRVCLFFLMVTEHGRIIHFINVVAGKDEHIIRVVPLDEADVLADGVCRAGIPFAAAALHIGREDVNAAGVAVKVPCAAVAEISVQLKRLVLGEHTHGVHPGIDAVGQREVNDAVFAPEGNRRLCRAVREHAKARTLSAGKQHCDHAFFDHTRVPPYQMSYELALKRLPESNIPMVLLGYGPLTPRTAPFAASRGNTRPHTLRAALRRGSRRPPAPWKARRAQPFPRSTSRA